MSSGDGFTTAATRRVYEGVFASGGVKVLGASVEVLQKFVAMSLSSDEELAAELYLLNLNDVIWEELIPHVAPENPWYVVGFPR